MLKCQHGEFICGEQKSTTLVSTLVKNFGKNYVMLAQTVQFCLTGVESESLLLHTDVPVMY